jgi:hypothetical protein
MENTGQVISRDEKEAIIQAILELTGAVISVRSMIFSLRAQDNNSLFQNFDASHDAIQKVHNHVRLLIEALEKDA